MPTSSFEEFTIRSEVGEPIEFTGTITSLSSEDGLWYCTPNDSLTISLTDWNSCIAITSANFSEPRPLRLKCEYCGCVSSKDYGTCEFCGAPLVPLEYIY